jgi:hypothetical protein
MVALVLVAAAQTSFAQDLGVGGRIGPTFTTFGGDADPDSKTGFTVSGFFTYSFGKLVGTHPELSFVRKGASSTSSGFGQGPDGEFLEITIRQTVDLDYVEFRVPVALTLPVVEHTLGLRAYAGPSVAFELGCHVELQIKTEEISPMTLSSTGSESETVSGGCDEEFGGRSFFVATKRIDFGMLFGAGLNVRVGRGALTGDVRYDLGLTDINDEGSGSIKNRAFEVVLGYARYISG